MKTLLSFVVPVYRGEKFLEDLAAAINNVKQEIESTDCPLKIVESIYVIDGASDNSTAVLENLGQEYDYIRIIHLSKNFGQHPATMAGILFSVGDWIITLDEDLQHNPKHILSLLRTALIDRLDIVYAKSTTPTHSSIRNFMAKLAKRAVEVISTNTNVSDFNSFRLVRGDIARAAAGLAASNTYFDIALGWFTNKVGIYSVPLSDSRVNSRRGSGYSLRKLINHTVNLVITSDTHVLRLGIVLGGIGVASSIVVIVFTLVVVIVVAEKVIPMGWASISVAVLFFGGLISLMLGIGLEYIGNLYAQSQGKPAFFVIDRTRDFELMRWFESNTE
jgi:glycosyltransferase involved in cell wall biosynthesis